MFGEKKNNKLSIYQFDKKSLYKGKKNIKLNFSSTGFPFVESNRCFIHKTLYLNDLCSINLKGAVASIFINVTANCILIKISNLIFRLLSWFNILYN